MTRPIPRPTLIYRIVHIDNLAVLLQRHGLHAPNHVPGDGLCYHTIHNVSIQMQRRFQGIPCGPGGTIHDYVPFYFGPRSPMLYQLHTGRVEGYFEGQQPLIYLVSTVEEVIRTSLRFVFSDGHGIAHFTRWFDDIERLDEVDWEVVYARIWKDTIDSMDRQRRKQAEFLIYQECPWSVVNEIGVLNSTMEARVRQVLGMSNVPPVNVHEEWYY